MPTVSPVPQGQSALVPHLVAKNCAKAIDFYKIAFGATEEFRLVEPSGKIGHAELRIGGALIMLADEYPDFGAVSPPSVGGCPVKLQLYVTDADAAVARAVAAGATVVREAKTEFYGDRTATVADPFGYTWQIASRVENVSPTEMQARWNKMMQWTE
jgi:PhnB protein